jgi:hypothetical protein
LEKKSLFKLFLSDDWNIVVQVEVLDVEVGRTEKSVRGCKKK